MDATLHATWKRAFKRELERPERTDAERGMILKFKRDISAKEQRMIENKYLSAGENIETLERHRREICDFMTNNFAKKGMIFCKRSLKFGKTRNEQRERKREGEEEAEKNSSSKKQRSAEKFGKDNRFVFLNTFVLVSLFNSPTGFLKKKGRNSFFSCTLKLVLKLIELSFSTC